MTAILKGGNIDLSSSSKSGVLMPPSLAMFVENRELLMLLTTSVSPQNLAIFEASESLRSFNSVCFTVSSMEFEGFYGVGWRSPVSVRATATPGLERFHRKIATMGEGMGELSLADRAIIANMSPEYGATMGFFPVDHVTLQYLKLTGRSNETVSVIEAYLRANNMFVDYNEI